MGTSNKSIGKTIKRLEKRKPVDGLTGWDYVYNYFYGFYEDDNIPSIASIKNIERSCLHLAAFLANWGMFRGGAFIAENNYKYFEGVIKTISETDKKLWEIDVDSYLKEGNIKQLLRCYKKISKSFKGEKPTATLITKIMMGVFGNIPAFDRYFRKGLKVYSVNEKSLQKVSEFYEKHKVIIDAIDIKTRPYYTGENKLYKYPKAKLIDKIVFDIGV